MVRATLDQVPQLDPSTIDDLQLGAGLPEGYQGGNLARVVATRLGMDTVPGATVTRFCASSIETTRTAFHAIRSGEARAVISAGVESLSFGTGSLVEAAAREAPPPWHDPREDGELPGPYILIGRSAASGAELRGISRQAQAGYGVRSQQRAEAAIASGFFDRDITPVTLADGTVVSADDSPRAGTTLEKVSTLDPVFRSEEHTSELQSRFDLVCRLLPAKQ